MGILIKCQHLMGCYLATIPISILIRADGVIMNEIGNRAESLLAEAPKRDSPDRTREDQHEDDNFSLWDIMWNGRPSRRLRGRPG